MGRRRRAASPVDEPAHAGARQNIAGPEKACDQGKDQAQGGDMFGPEDLFNSDEGHADGG